MSTLPTAARILRQQNPLNLHGAELKAWCIDHARDVGLVRLRGRTARLTRHRAKAKAGRKVWAKYVSSSGELVPEVITTKLVLAAPPDISVISGVEIRRPRAGKVRAK